MLAVLAIAGVLGLGIFAVALLIFMKSWKEKGKEVEMGEYVREKERGHEYTQITRI